MVKTTIGRRLSRVKIPNAALSPQARRPELLAEDLPGFWRSYRPGDRDATRSDGVHSTRRGTVDLANQRGGPAGRSEQSHKIWLRRHRAGSITTSSTRWPPPQSGRQRANRPKSRTILRQDGIDLPAPKRAPELADYRDRFGLAGCGCASLLIATKRIIKPVEGGRVAAQVSRLEKRTVVARAR
jgi:hypothetical protein